MIMSAVVLVVVIAW